MRSHNANIAGESADCHSTQSAVCNRAQSPVCNRAQTNVNNKTIMESSSCIAPNDVPTLRRSCRLRKPVLRQGFDD